MNTWVIPASFGAISKKFLEQPIENSLAAGIQASFGVISYKGKQWAVRYRGNTTMMMAENNRDPAFSIEVVILKSSPAVSKTFYDHAYVEGSNDPPDCMAMNGVIPDASSPKKQAEACAICPNNVWGSRHTPDGKAAKACADNKRLAVVLMPNMLDETFGGPLLLRVPPASLQELASYGNALAQHGYHEHAVVTRVSFDMKEAYPRFVWSPVRPLSDNEADISIHLRNSAEVSRILAEALEYVTPADSGKTGSFFEQGPTPATPQTLQRAVTQVQGRPQTIQGQAVPAQAPIQGQAVPTQAAAPVVPAALAQAAQEAAQQEAVQEVEAVQEEVAQEVEAAAEDLEGIPAFLRRSNGGTAPAEEVPDDKFMDDIDAKLSAMLP